MNIRHLYIWNWLHFISLMLIKKVKTNKQTQTQTNTKKKKQKLIDHQSPQQRNRLVAVAVCLMGKYWQIMKNYPQEANYNLGRCNFKYFFQIVLLFLFVFLYLFYSFFYI